VDAAPDGNTFAYGQSNGRVVIRNRVGGAVVREFANHSAAVNAVEYSASGNRLVTASNDRKALLFDPTTGALLREFNHDLAVNDATISPDGNTIATCGEDNVVKIWNANSGALLATFGGHGAAVNALAFSPDGTRIASGGDDNVVRVLDLSGVQLAALSAHTDDVQSVAFSPDGTEIVSGGADAAVRVWDAGAFTALRNTTICASPIVSVQYSSDGGQLLVGVSARNAIQLDTDPASGNDLAITYPQALQLDNVPSLGGSLPTGVYYLWAEIDTDRTDPVRTYANPIVQVVPPFTAAVDSTTPVIPFFDDRASVVVSPNKIRQVMDLGTFAQGDRIYLSMLNTPGFGELYDLDRDFSLFILDADQNIYAWYQSDFVLFTRETRLIIGHSSPHYYLVSDGSVGVNLRVERSTGLYAPRQQRVFVDFRGGAAIGAGSIPPQNVPALNASTFNQFFTVNPNFTDATDTPLLAQGIMQELRSVYAGLNVQFVGTNETTTPPALPYKTLYVGNAINESLYGIADYLNPRNDTETGSGIIFALGIGEAVIDNNAFSNPPVSGNPSQALSDLGRIIGNVAAHECGHLLGLRHTSEPLDLMQTEGTNADDITLPRVLKSGTPAAGEQIDLLPPFFSPDVPPIGVQNAIQYLLEVVGGA